MNVPALIVTAVLGGSLLTLAAIVLWDARAERLELQERLDMDAWVELWESVYALPSTEPIR